jgi:hypothetical protein
MSQFQEPPFAPDDTHPTITIRPVDFDPTKKKSSWVGGVMLMGALIFTVATIGVFLFPNNTPPVVPPIQQETSLTLEPTLETVATLPMMPTQEIQTVIESNNGVVPTISAVQINNLLQAPIANLQTSADGNALRYDPFTVLPERPRSEDVSYTAVSGDTIDTIARLFNLKPETLAWCNDRRIVFVLRPGDVLRVPPVDGACHVVLGTRQETIASVAEQYNVTPQSLINSPFSNFIDLTPESILPGGINIFIPGGEGELITWNPPSEIETDSAGNVITVAFANGQAGSCGAVAPGGGTAWGNPLPNGTWMRGFSVGHTGIDLAAPTGTPIFAANGGPVLFSGFSNWGYGEAVVLGHGLQSTLYGHMSQRNVACNQVVGTGQVVGLVGSTGNSTGPHLHFEIRFNDAPQNPSGTPGIGW